MAEKTDIEKDLEKLKANQTKYDKPDRYYDGDHDLAFATQKFVNAFGSLFKEFSMNLCPAVVDAVRDKLVVTGFRVEEGGGNVPDEAWKIWQLNRMGKRAGEIHREALKNGDAYAIVWTDPEGRVTIYPQNSVGCTVTYDPEVPGKILRAAKIWTRDDKLVRLNLYYPDRIEKLITEKPSEGGLPEAKLFKPYKDEGGDKVPNPYGVVPVFHFGNNADIGQPGQSELHNVMPVQDGLNKAVLDMLVAMEFSSFRQRWVAGIELAYDDAGEPIAPFKTGAERIWLTENHETKFGDFEATDLTQFLAVKESFTIDVARVSGTPLYYFVQAGGSHPSGESLKKSETRFIKKVRDRQESFGNTWEDVMSFALMIQGGAKIQDSRLFTEWEDPAPLTEKENLENLMIKQELGVSVEQLLTEAGYGIDDIKKMLEAAAAKREEEIAGFNRGEIGGEADGEMNVGS